MLWVFQYRRRDDNELLDDFQTIEIMVVINYTPITVAERSKARIVFAYSNNRVVISNPTRRMDICLSLFYICAVLCVGRSPATGWSLCLYITWTPWLESASKLYRHSGCRLSANLVPTFADRGCHVVVVTDSYGRILSFLDWSSHFFFQVALRWYSRG
jgi:hypothetical protein